MAGCGTASHQDPRDVLKFSAEGLCAAVGAEDACGTDMRVLAPGPDANQVAIAAAGRCIDCGHPAIAEVARMMIAEGACPSAPPLLDDEDAIPGPDARRYAPRGRR